jgi:uncharacterized protein (DUF302 family)
MEPQPQATSHLDNGLMERLSPYSVAETLDRLAAILAEKGIKIFVRIDQKAEAEQVGLTLRPTQLLLFGDPKTGTSLMNAYPSLAIDLPLKAVAWEAPDGTIRLNYNSPAYFQRRHDLPVAPFTAVEALIDRALE